MYSGLQNLMFCVGCLCCFFLWVPSLSADQKNVAFVEKIIDGDTIRVRYHSKSVKVRLWGIDTPEYHQPYSKTAKKFTSKMLDGQSVYLQIKDWDDYGRMVAMVTLSDNRCLNEELVKSGMAWVHIYYCKEDICDQWRSYEQEARSLGKGLWREKSPVPPWVWKRSRYGKR